MKQRLITLQRATVLFPWTWCRGRICLGCDHAIRRYGVRLGNQWIEAFAHRLCVPAIVRDVPELAP